MLYFSSSHGLIDINPFEVSRRKHHVLWASPCGFKYSSILHCYLLTDSVSFVCTVIVNLGKCFLSCIMTYFASFQSEFHKRSKAQSQIPSPEMSQDPRQPWCSEIQTSTMAKGQVLLPGASLEAVAVEIQQAILRQTAI